MLDIRPPEEHKTNCGLNLLVPRPSASPKSPAQFPMNQPVFENNRRRAPSDGSDHASEMMRDGSLPARRRFELIRLAQRQGQLSVADLSSQFGVSSDTIRRDLDLLSLRGFVRRTHGGAIPADYLGQGDPSPVQWVGSRVAEKTRIAEYASELIQDGESLILNGGSTTRLLAFELARKRNLTIFTNALGIPAALPRQAVRDVVVLGGEYRAESHTTVGSVAFCGAIAVSTDSAILGVGGITQDGIFAGLLQDAAMTASMIAVARRTIVLADSAQFNHRLLARIATLDRIDILVTDAEPPKDLFAALEKLEVQVMVAPPLNSRQRARPRTESGSNLTVFKSRS
jgi:DeoR family transcriptional regulator, fructose operon transcriptional repressor